MGLFDVVAAPPVEQTGHSAQAGLANETLGHGNVLLRTAGPASIKGDAPYRDSHAFSSPDPRQVKLIYLHATQDWLLKTIDRERQLQHATADLQAEMTASTAESTSLVALMAVESFASLDAGSILPPH